MKTDKQAKKQLLSNSKKNMAYGNLTKMITLRFRFYLQQLRREINKQTINKQLLSNLKKTISQIQGLTNENKPIRLESVDVILRICASNKNKMTGKRENINQTSQ